MANFAVDHHLRQCISARGMFVVLAVDHRANLVEQMEKAYARPVDYREVVAFKQAALRHLAGVSTAVLTDPNYGFPALVDSRVSSSCGLLAPLEVTDYSLHPSQHGIEFIEEWGVTKVKKSGCSGVKLLLYYHPNAKDADVQTSIVDRTVEECRQHGIPLFLEPIAYSLDPDVPLGNEERSQIVIDAARHFSRRGVDVLKVQFPLDTAVEPDEEAWMSALRALDEACEVPWALLSAGVSFDVFLKQTIAACKAGASGVIVGRSVWGDGVALQNDALDEFMRTTAKSRIQALTNICDLYGTPWHVQAARPELQKHWYHSL